MTPLVAAGELLRLRESQYRYGAGDLTIRVTAVAAVASDPDWVDVTGIEIGWNGDRHGKRSVRVSVAALRDPGSRAVP